MWDILVLGTYLILSCFYLWAQVRAEVGRMSRTALRAVSVVALVCAVLVHSVTAWIFGLQQGREMWHTALLAPWFVSSALVCGTALVMTVAIALRRAGYLELDQSYMVKLAKLLGAFVMVDLYFFGCDLLTEAFPGGSGAEVVAMLATGPLAPYFWTEIAGCAACAEGCPKNAIHMLPDREGFLYPTVTDACIQCGHCTHICPVLRQREAHPEPAVFAAWNPDNAVRQDSTCGGVFSLLADYVLEGGGVVFGAGMDAQLRVRHEAVKRKEDLPRIRGAKPVQSDVTGIYQQVRRELDRGRPVLFSGTPCQVDGLYHYLGEHPEKLLTCDVLCRGVCSPGVWAKLVQSMAYIKRKQPVAVQFCGKLPGQRERRFQVRFDDGTTFDSPLSKSEFGRGFFGNLFLRPACHTCPYASVDRPGDLSLGVFYGLPKDAYPQEQRSGVSLLLVNTPHGAHVFDTLPLKRELRPLSEAVTGDPALSSPVKQAAQRAEFFDAYARQPFQQVRNHYLAAQLLSGSRKQGARPGKRSEKPSLFTVIKERLWKKH